MRVATLQYYTGVHYVPGKYICQDSACVCSPKTYYSGVDCAPSKYGLGANLRYMGYFTSLLHPPGNENLAAILSRGHVLGA